MISGSFKAAFLASLALLAGCVSLPHLDGTHSEKPAVSRYDFSVRLSDESTIAEQCRERENKAGVRTDACVHTVRMPDRYDSTVWIPPPHGFYDAWWWETMIHEIAHPVFNWRH